jgi:hypothetical protein
MPQGSGKRLTKEQKDQIWSWYFDDRLSSEEIAKRVGKSGVAVRAFIKRSGGEIRGASEAHRKYDHNPHAFSKLTDQAAYFIGLLMADGYVNKKSVEEGPKANTSFGIALHGQDVDVLHKLKSFLGSQHPVTIYKNKEGRPRCRFSIRCNHIVKDLAHWGVRNKKTSTAKAHPGLIDNTHFWRGVVDGDGEIDCNDGCPELSLISSAQLMGQFLDFIGPLITPAKAVSVPSVKGRCNLVCRLHGHSAQKVIEAIYEGQSLGIDRKVSMAHHLIKTYKGKSFRILNMQKVFPWSYTDQRKAEDDFAKLKDMDCTEDIKNLLRKDHSNISGTITKRKIGLYASGFHSERVRAFAYYRDGISPRDAWKNKDIKEKIWHEAKIGKHSNLRASLTANCRWAWAFPPSVAKAIYQLTNTTSVFDPCAGWGDRLTAAIACDIPYLGCDPNTLMGGCYSRVIAHYGNDDPKFKVVTSAVEDYNLGKGFADLAFTSPPYYNAEIYSDDVDQSCFRYQTPESWKEGFLRTMVEQCHRALVDGGSMVINITNVKDERGVEIPLVDWLSEEAHRVGMRYYGCLSIPAPNYYHTHQGEGVYFFRK